MIFLSFTIDLTDDAEARQPRLYGTPYFSRYFTLVDKYPSGVADERFVEKMPENVDYI